LFEHGKNIWQYPPRRRRFGIILASIFLPLIVFGASFNLFDRLNNTPQTGEMGVTQAPISEGTESFAIRKIVWKGGILLGIKHPIFGTGPETFAYTYYQTRLPEHNSTSEWDFIYNKAHNEYVHFFATTGIVGVLSYLYLIVSILMYSIRSYRTVWNRSGQGSNHLILYLMLSLISIFITNFFGFSTTNLNLLLFLLPAVMVVYFEPGLKLPTMEHHNFGMLPSRRRGMLVIPLAIAIIGTVFVTTYVMADMLYAQGESYRQAQDNSQAAQYYRMALRLRNEHVYKDKLSQTLANMSFLAGYALQNPESTETPAYTDQITNLRTESETYINDAIEASTQNPLYLRTKAKNNYLFFQVDKREETFQKAFEALSMARRLAPTDPKLPYTAALFYVSRADTDKKSLSSSDKDALYDNALREINTALQLKSNYRDALIVKGSTLKSLKRFDEARQTYESILILYPNDEEARAELGNLP